MYIDPEIKKWPIFANHVGRKGHMVLNYVYNMFPTELAAESNT